ncbi:MAG: PRC-barrel domain-containing protein [Chthoniobacterales bacterium]
MKKLLSAVTICGLALGLTALPALGQQHDEKGFHGQLIRSSQLIGADLYNTTGDDIGQVNDVVFDENSGGMMHAILAAGGFIGIGDKLTPVTWDAITVKTTTDGKIKVTTTLDKAKLSAEKSYEKSTWTKNDEAWKKDFAGSTDKKLVRMSTVDDAKLFDKSGNHIGEIDDVIVDAKSGKAAYAVVSFKDEFIKKGDDMMTMVPWTLVRQSEKDTPGFVLHADKAKIEAGTFFDEKNWPDMNSLSWNKEIYDHFAVTPYYWTGV